MEEELHGGKIFSRDTQREVCCSGPREMMMQGDGSRCNGRRYREYFGDCLPKTTGDELGVMGEEEESVSNDTQVIVSRRGN